MKREKMHQIFYGILFLVIALLFVSVVKAATPNPGHPWAEVGNGDFSVTGASTMRVYTVPDYNTTLLNSGSFNQGDLIYGSAASTTAQLPKDTNSTRYLSNTGTSNNPAWAQVALTTGVSGILPIANGGTNASLTLANGGVIYSTASALGVSGVGSAGQVLQSNGAATPVWSTATYPATAGTSGNILTSNGTNFTSAAPNSITTIQTLPYNATGASATFSLTGNTSFRVGLFPVHSSITVNQISILPGTITTNSTGGLKICIYNEAGTTKLIDQTTAQPTASTILTTTVGTPATLVPGNYYIAVGCVTSSCSALTVTSFLTTAFAFENGATVPSGKKVYEGTTTMTAGTCNSTITPTTAGITGAITSTVNARLDN